MQNAVLLVNPPIYDFAAFDLFTKPMGLLYLGGLLKRSGVSVHLADALDRRHPVLNQYAAVPGTRNNGTGKYVREQIDTPSCLRPIARRYCRYGIPSGLFEQLLSDAYEQYKPSAVLVTSMMTYWYPAVSDTIATIRRLMPGVPVGLGGVYATLMPDHAQRVCRPDRVFRSNAIHDLFCWLHDAAGIKLDCDSASDCFLDWPRPAYELYAKLNYLTVVTSLGCPFRCDYCAGPVIQPRLVQLEPDVFVSQLQELIDLWNPDQDQMNVAFIDDALLAGAADHFLPILRRIQQMDRPFRFHCPNGLHGRFITDEVARCMFENHFEMVRISYESAQGGLAWRSSDGKITDRHFEQAVSHLMRAGYPPCQLEAYVLTGLPGQEMAEIERSVRSVHRMGLKVRLCQYTPIPGTAMFGMACERYGIDPDEPLLHNNSILPGLDRHISLTAYQQFKDYVNRFNHRLSEKNGGGG